MFIYMFIVMYVFFPYFTSGAPTHTCELIAYRIQHSFYLPVLATDQVLASFHRDESSVYFKSCRLMYLQLCKFVHIYECCEFLFVSPT